MYHFVLAAMRHQDQFTSLQSHGFRVRLVHESPPFRHSFGTVTDGGEHLPEKQQLVGWFGLILLISLIAYIQVVMASPPPVSSLRGELLAALLCSALFLLLAMIWKNNRPRIQSNTKSRIVPSFVNGVAL